jgi:SagB-type dehydrogenase family enzyme
MMAERDAMPNQYREFLKDSIRKQIDFSQTAQSLGLAEPPRQKPCPAGAKKFALAMPGNWPSIPAFSLEAAIAQRKSRRRYTKQALGLEELSFLLWAIQGIRPSGSAHSNFRTVPSAGCRHALETYVVALRVTGLEKAVYRYLPFDHALVEVVRHPGLEERLSQATFGQAFCGAGAAAFAWTAIPERMEWRYGAASYKVIALDAGHVCQNLYLACENIGAGTCAVAAYDQERIDEVLGVDGENEFAIYLAPVGKVAALQDEDQ